MKILEFMSNYAFNEIKKLLDDLDCEEIVANSLVEKFGIEIEAAEAIVETEMKKWVDAYVD